MILSLTFNKNIVIERSLPYHVKNNPKSRNNEDTLCIFSVYITQTVYIAHSFNVFNKERSPSQSIGYERPP